MKVHTRNKPAYCMYINVNAREHTSAFFHNGNVNTGKGSVCVFMPISIKIIICARTLLKHSHKCIESYQLICAYKHKQHEHAPRAHVCLHVCLKVHACSESYKGLGVSRTLIPNPSTDINKKPNPNKQKNHNRSTD